MDARKISPAASLSGITRVGVIPTGGLICHLDATNYRCYTGSAPTFFDLSGWGNNMTLFNTPTYADTAGGKAFTFNGTTQHGQFLNTSSLSNFTSGMTIISVANMGTAQNYARLIDIANGGPNNNILICRNATTNNLMCEFYSGTTSAFIHTVTGGVLNSQWAFYAWSFNTTTSTVRVNNTISTVSKSATMPVNISRTINYVGRSNWAADSYFNGSIQTLLMYNKYLDETQITKIYRVFQRRFSL